MHDLERAEIVGRVAGAVDQRPAVRSDEAVGRDGRHAVTFAATSPSSSSFATTTRCGLLRLEAFGVHDDLRIGRRLVRVVDAREALDLTCERLRVEAVHVAPGAFVERRANVDLDEGTVLLHERARVLPRLLVGRDRGDDDRAAVTRDARSDPAEPLDMSVTILLGEAEALREMGANRVAVQILDDVPAAVQLGADVVRDRRLARAGETGEPEGEASTAIRLGLGVLVRVDVLTHAVLSMFVDLVNAALELVRAGPATGALLLVRGRRAGARDAADRAVPRVVQRVGGYLVDVDVRPHPLLVPVGERVDLEDLVALRPLHLRRVDAARRLVAANPRDPGVVRLQRLDERLDLADVAAAVGIALPEVRPLGAMLLGDRRDRRLDELQLVAIDQRVARVVGLAEEEVRVELDRVHAQAELGDHVHEHGRLLLPRAREADARPEELVRPGDQLLGRHGLEVEIRELRLAQRSDGQAAPPSACRRADRGEASRAR